LGALLEVRGLSLDFAGVRALAGVDLRVDRGEAVALVGPNGSGKTTLLNCISGFYRPDRGALELGGESLLGLAPDAIARRGVSRTFQDLRLFPGLSVLDNLLVGRHGRFTRRFGDVLLRRRAEEMRQRRHCEELAERLGLADWRARPAGECPYGVQKRVELGRALAAEPLLLLLDEPAAGLSAGERHELTSALQALREPLGPGLVVVEHDLHWVSSLAGRMLALEQGRVIAAGTPSEVRSSPAVARAYLED
jgi:branched-chain amino acid transport system ATP-binding protein